VAPRPLPLNQLSPAVALVDLAARVSVRGFEIGINATNLFDRRNQDAVFNYISNFRGPTQPASMLPMQHFAAGPPRQFLFTLQGTFNGK
jgi:outer membrane receptor protein involved in Fe transport